MTTGKIIFLLGTIIIFSSPAEFSSEKEKTLIENKYTRLQAREERQLRSKKQHTPTTENITVSDDDDERKTLAQQVLDGKYGLIQTEIFSSPVKRPGILSYEVNPEVPRDNINNLGGLKPEEIWLAENHLLVIKGGGFSDTEQAGKVSWPPIDNYIAPQRQVKIPPNPKIPPPFPIQLKEGGPIEVIKEKNNSKSYPPVFNGGPFGPPFLFPLMPNAPLGSNEDETKQSQGNFTEGNGGAPFPFLPPGLGLYPPAIAFLPPPGNLTELDEDDPRIYYPPRYDFVYKNNYSSYVPPGPLVPGIILPPPPNFFAPLENNTSSRLTQINKQRNSAKKLSKPRVNIINSSRHKITTQSNGYKTKGVNIANELKNTSPVHVLNKHYERKPISPQTNVTNNEWMPIPAPRPFYITDLNKLKAIANNRGNDPSLKYVGPKNGWDYDNTNTTELPKILQNPYHRNNKNSGRGNKMKDLYFEPERNEENLNSTPLPQTYTTQQNKNNFKTTVLPKFYTTGKYDSTIKPDNLPTYFTTPYIEQYKTDAIQQIEIDTLKVANPPRINLEKPNYLNKNSQIPRGKFLRPTTTNSPALLYDQYTYNKPQKESTFIPQRVYSDVTVKTPSLNGRIIIPNIKYEDNNRNTVKQTSKPLSFLYYEQESKYQQDDSGYSYEPPIRAPLNPYRQERYNEFTQVEDNYKRGPISTTQKTPIYEYSYSAPGYGTVEAPKVGNNLGTTPKPLIYEANFKSIKQPQYSYIDFQSTQQNEYEQKPNKDHSLYTTPHPPINSNQYNTENPYSSYTTQDLGLLDEITKKYFTLFGQKINSDNTREITPTPLPQVKDSYYDKQYFQNYETVAPVPTKAPSVNIRFPSLYNIQNDRPHFQSQTAYNTPKFRAPIRKQKPANNHQTENYSYFYAQTDDAYQDYKEYDEELVRPNHPLDSDIAVNYKIPNPQINPDAEFIDPQHVNPPLYLSGNSYVSYKLPGNSGHFYFLTPQTIEQQNYPYQNPRIRYQDVKHSYAQRDVRDKILKGN